MPTIITVYVLFSLKSNIFYVGISNDVNRRLEEHNKRRSKFTSGHVPWKLVYTEKHNSYSEARERERYLKSSSGKRWLKKQLNDMPGFHPGNRGSLPD